MPNRYSIMRVMEESVNPRDQSSVNVLHDICSSLPEDVALLAQLVAIGSPSTDGPAVTRVQFVLMSVLESLGMSCELIPEAGRGSHLLARTKAAMAADRSIFLVAHADTVHDIDTSTDQLHVDGALPTTLPPAKTDALALKAFGPGSLDLKGGVVCIVSALRSLAKTGKLDQLPITFFVNSCEEDGTDHATEFIVNLAKQASLALVFEFGRDEDRIVTQRKGLRCYRLVAIGQAAHSGLVNTTNAIEQLFRIGYQFAGLTDLDCGIRVNFGTVSGGGKVNIVAEQAILDFEVRAPTAADLGQVEAALHAIVSHASAKLVRTSEVPPMSETAASTKLMDSYARHGRLLGLGCERAPLQGGVSDANLFAAAGVPTIDGLGPWGQHAHTRQEYVDLCSIPYKAANLAMWLLANASDYST